LVCRSDQLQHDMHDPIFRLLLRLDPLLSKTLSIGTFSGRTSATNSLSPAWRANCGKMLHQCTADTLALMLGDDHEGHLGRARLQYDVTTAADDRRSAPFMQHCHQSNVADKIDVQEEIDLLLRGRNIARPKLSKTMLAGKGMVQGIGPVRRSLPKTSATISGPPPSQVHP
jgi:hypothetical protein